MDEMNVSELLVKEAKQNQIREILEIIKDSESLKEAEEKTRALLNK